MKIPIINTLLYVLVSVLPSSSAYKRPGCVDLNSFCSYNDVQQYLGYLKETYPNKLELEEIGRTFHGHKITLVKIPHTGRHGNEMARRQMNENDEHEKDDENEDDEDDDEDEDEDEDEDMDEAVEVRQEFNEENETRVMGIWVDSMIHAREWLCLPVTLHLLEQLIEKADQNNDMLQYFDWYILPVVNPSGYEFSRTTDRMWRKNRSPSDDHCKCYKCGVDLNRNFDIDFQTGSNAECSEIYHGPRAESEPETKALSGKLRQLKDKLIMYFALHSAGSVYYIPWAHKAAKCADYAELDAMAKTMVDAIFSVYGRKFTTENFGLAIQGPASGGADDYAKHLGIKYSYTVELPAPQNLDAETIFHADAKQDAGKTAKEQLAAFRAATRRLIGIYIDKSITPVSGGHHTNRSKKPRGASARNTEIQITLFMMICIYAVQQYVR